MNKYGGEVFLTQTIVMTEVVALVFQGVERLVFDFPAGTAGAHYLVNVVAGDGEIRNPAEI